MANEPLSAVKPPAEVPVAPPDETPTSPPPELPETEPDQAPPDSLPPEMPPDWPDEGVPSPEFLGKSPIVIQHQIMARKFDQTAQIQDGKMLWIDDFKNAAIGQFMKAAA